MRELCGGRSAEKLSTHHARRLHHTFAASSYFIAVAHMMRSRLQLPDEDREASSKRGLRELPPAFYSWDSTHQEVRATELRPAQHAADVNEARCWEAAAEQRRQRQVQRGLVEVGFELRSPRELVEVDAGA
eukprot:CAMPEP_0178407478 /NCGR_PEP_ID=MMETSP0689_2-20121128/19450_1 /TAXON_ID=160604 /ORGANISM="Amphidinium massartii, Strain CS-259" /LENGTH=130 /DNA_ID=CAMNT_0020028555 /DNA_START=674 /DNA_END=1066 /DNA_ORIENTATION=-